MKHFIFLLIGIIIVATACQDDFVETENDLSQVEKSARYEKMQTFKIKGWAEVIPDWDAGTFTCTPEEYGVAFCSRGWVSGHENILGTIVREQSIYEKESCNVELTEEGLIVLNVVTADILRTNGNRTFVICHMWINLDTGEIWGQNDFTGGTGRFEGITGTTYIRNAKRIPENGGISWEEDGYLTLILK